MKKFNTFFLRFRASTLKFTLWLLGIAGFGLLMSCSKYGAPMAEYGVPYPDNALDFHGKVVSADSSLPVPGIQIKVYSDYEDTITASTNVAGDYSALKPAYENQKVMLVFSDKDGAQNGKFFDKTVEVDVSFRDVNNLEHQADVQLQRKP